MTAKHPLYLVSLTVAVTGHRDIAPADEERTRTLVQSRFGELQRQCPATPIMVLSGLAEGADMVCADAALDLGIEVVPILPSPPEVFAKDFERPAHGDRDPEELAQRFRTLLERCAAPIVVAESLTADEPRRYALVGAYLARHCHILFALWDEVENDVEGGTSHVVQLVRGGVSERYLDEPKRALDAPEPRPIHHLAVPRFGETPSRLWAWSLLQVSAAEQKHSQGVLVALDCFNADAATFAANHPQAITKSLAWFDADATALSRVERRALEVFAAADAFAISLRNSSHQSLKTIFVIGWLMVAAFEVYSNIWGLPSVLGLYIVGLLAAAAIYFLDRSRKTYTRFLDYRGLAEGLRVQIFYHLAGLPILAADHYLRKQRGELTWIRQAMRALDVGPRRSAPRFDLVKKYWIDDQASYFNSASRRDRLTFNRNKRWALGFFISGLVVAGAGFGIEMATGGKLHDALWMHLLIAMMGFLPATAAALTGYTDRRGLGQHIKQYERMQEVYGRAASIATSLEEATDPESCKRLAAELGKEALAENADWILLHRERPIDLPNR